MRWGVRDEATDDHQTMTICRDEVIFSVITRNSQIEHSITLAPKKANIFLNSS